ncbi:MAG: hypothetical protein PHU56_00030 [Candidatus Pacebacteria bacterium]|nr:hypothetical protein [Candidatus Paceibacterota bacterium]
MREGEPSGGQKYLKHTGKESLPVKIVSKKKIGRGIFGEVSFSETEIVNNDKVKNKNFAVKLFKSEERALKALNNFKKLKESGLKVFTTYRLAEDGKSILMTYGDKPGSLLVSFNRSENLKYLENHPIKEIAGFGEFIDSMGEHAKLAADKKIIIPNDAYFFSVSDTADQDTKSMDFIIGDLDTITYPNQEGFDGNSDRKVFQNKESRIAEINLYYIGRALGCFVETCIDKSSKPKYYALLDEKFKDRTQA